MTSLRPQTAVASAEPRPAPGASGAELFDRVAEASRAARLGAPRLVSLPAPWAPLAAALPARVDRASLWAPPEGLARVTWGGDSEASPMNTLTAPAALDRLGALVRVGDGPPPVLLGGFAFERGDAAASWSPLGAARWTLPRYSYLRGAAGAYLQVVLTGDEDDPIRDVAEVLDRLADPPPRSSPPAFSIADVGDRAAWTRAVEAAQIRMRAGTLDKAVLSRRIRLVATAAPTVAELVAALTAEDAPVTRFLFAEGDAVFIGATPERLARVVGRQVETEALAGSRPAGEDPERLFDDPKEREEHAHVVRHLQDRLRRLGASLVHPERPELRRLGYVTHLRTPMRAELPTRKSLFEVADALHPTPAVGGAPLADALRAIRDNEPGPRGWYAGAVGWVDAAGEGDLWVALRSAHLEGARGAAYVGAGIVAGSDPDREWAETQAKAEAMLGALGVGR